MTIKRKLSVTVQPISQYSRRHTATRMDRWEGKVAVVTGASSGIGAAIAESLVKAGLSVVGLARRSERLDKLSASLDGARGKLCGRKCDVTKEEDLLNAFKWVNAELGGVDILVNNAGVIHKSTIIGGDVESFRRILDVNVLATAISIREAVASMKSRDAPGYIININSVVGHYIPSAVTQINLYTSSKYAVTALTETVRKELSAEPNNKIKITSISPGFVKTEILEVSGFPDGTYDVTPYLEPEDIVDAVLYVLGTRDRVQVSELTIRPAGEQL